MKKTMIVLPGRVKIALLYFLLILPGPVTSKAGGVVFPGTMINEEQFVRINGIEQWVTIHGESTKPVIFFLHGGPGSTLSPYSANLYKSWEKDFIIVQWDQRGAGKTFGRTAPDELTPAYLKGNLLTVEQMVSDGIAVAEYLLKRLDKKKLILFGASWGSVLGVKMATQKPDLFSAYIGHSQVTDPADDLELYVKVYQLAEANKDTESVQLLRTIGLPPYSEARNAGKLFRIVKKYEQRHSAPAPESWFVVSPAYNNEKDNQNRSDGDDFSFVNYVGDKKLEVRSMRSIINIPRDNATFRIPVYLIQGKEDLLTPPEATKRYFDHINAPTKKYYLLPGTAHGFNQAVLDAQFEICKAIKTE